jgi:ABC-type amino acid transport substrate-binding protein
MPKLLAYASVVISLLALVIAYSPSRQSAPAFSKPETAYERVIRTRTLRCGWALWPIFEDIDPNTKELKGIVPEFTQALAQKLNLKIEWVMEVQWGQEPEALATGKIDAICSYDQEHKIFYRPTKRWSSG